MRDDHVVDTGHIAQRSIDLHGAVPPIMIEQLVITPNSDEMNPLSRVMALDEEFKGHTHELTGQLENLALLVILAIFQGHGFDLDQTTCTFDLGSRVVREYVFVEQCAGHLLVRVSTILLV